MKNFLALVLLIILTTRFSYGQSGPVSCNDLVVENLEMENDSTMKVTIRNNCDTCNWGAYCDIRIIQNSTDTIANSNCMCLFSPGPDTLTEYFLPSSVTSVPPIDQLRISHTCVCDTIPFSPSLGWNSYPGKETISIYPNPSSNIVTIQWQGNENASLQIFNSLGEEVLRQQISHNGTVLLQQKGIYFARIDNGERIYTEKIVIQ